MNSRLRIVALMIAAVVLFNMHVSVVAAAAPEGDAVDDFDFYIADQLTYDDNLYRLPDDVDAASLDPSGATASRDDYQHRMTAGADGRWQLSQQQFLLSARIDDNSYRYNDDLDHTAGRGKVEWQWSLGERWAGQLGGDYNRALAGFANTRLLVKDLVETTGYYWRGNVTVGSNWLVGAGARLASTEHSASARQFDDADTDTLDASIRYRTTLNNTFGVAYRHIANDYRAAPTLDASTRNYHDNTAGLTAHYALSEKTTVDAGVGYLKRDYSQGATRDGFSGGVWDAAVDWQPSVKTSLKVSAWRKLRAYLDAESDYFVATGGGVMSQWQPTEKLGFSVEVSREQRDYIAASANLAVADPRNDRADAAEFLVTYSPWRSVQIDLSWHVERRNSDRPIFEYDDSLASLAVRFTI